MLARTRLSLLSSAARNPGKGCNFSSSRLLREQQWGSLRGLDYGAKYAEKLQKRAQQRGKTLTELRNELKEQEQERRRQRLALEAQQQSSSPKPAVESAVLSSSTTSSSFGTAKRKDSSPVKPLNSIINLERLLRSPHTPEQLSILWKAYHSSRSDGTGRGFLSASLPVATYEKMLNVATRYPSFVVPMPRPKAQTDQPEDKPAYEFYFMEWGFHGAPPEPSANANPFAPPQPSSNPQTSTILFTPLQEYKLRASFATPYLVLTHYTDLAKSHGLVLLRGEITPSAAASSGAGANRGDEHFMLSQQDAQLLAIAVQRFYLWSEGENERTALLQAFHEKPGEFSWESLLKHTEYAL